MNVTADAEMFGGSLSMLSRVQLLNSDDYFISIIARNLPIRAEESHGVLNISDSSPINLSNYNIAKENFWDIYYRNRDTIIVKAVNNKRTYYGYNNNKPTVRC